MTFTFSTDPDDWDEDEWIRRIAAHALRYHLIPGQENLVVEAINRGFITLHHEGELIVLNHEIWDRAMERAVLEQMEMQLTHLTEPPTEETP